MRLDSSKAHLLRLCTWTKQKPSNYAGILGYSLSARNTILCLGQVLTLFRAEQVKLYTLFRTARPKNHTLSSGTYPYSPNKEVLPPPGLLGSGDEKSHDRHRYPGVILHDHPTGLHTVDSFRVSAKHALILTFQWLNIRCWQCLQARDQLFFFNVHNVNNAFCSRQGLRLQISSDQWGSAADSMKTTAMFVLLLAVFSFFQLITAGGSKNGSQPHIIFILADDLVSNPH